MLDIAATGSAVHMPFVPLHTGHAGRQTLERFYFDYADLCEQLRANNDCLVIVGRATWGTKGRA
jgi:hypothetical protein